MPFSFRPAIRENVPLIIGLAGGTGSGKTYSAMRLAKGLAGGRRFAVADTEAGRAKHYADEFDFDHGEVKPPFRPQAYLDAITAADEAGYPVIVVDSASHEHAGEGGLLDWHEEELQRLARNPSDRDRMTMAAWIEPKMAHKRFVQRLLQLRAHLILCFRAEPKIEISKDNGRTVVREKQSLVGYKGWIPIAEKTLAFEMTVFFMLLYEQPGVPQRIKLSKQHMPFFPEGQPITEDAGVALAHWAAGGVAKPLSWADRIAAARDVKALEVLGEELKNASLDDAARAVTRGLFRDRWNEIAKKQGAA
jgi:hypothetical protein